MWTITDLKKRASRLLKDEYRMNIIICVLIGILYIIRINIRYRYNFEKPIDNYNDIFNYVNEYRQNRNTTEAGFSNLLFVLNILFNIFVIAIFKLGYQVFLLSSRIRKTKIKAVIYGFKNRYLHNVFVLFFVKLVVFFWSLIFIVPGIIKSLEYRFVEYILAENPKLSRKRAMELSKEMMKGEKLNAFVLDLSFIGWFLLGVCTCGIVYLLYYMPYRYNTNAELYIALRRKAIGNGITTEAELGSIENDDALERKAIK